MTRIVLHPPLLPRYGPEGGSAVLLGEPWAWWRVRVTTDAMIRYEPSFPDSIEECVVEFGGDGTITDPPAMHLVTEVSYTDIWGGAIPRTLMDRYYVYCEVVWHEQPGPEWRQWPRRTCRPGDYFHGTVQIGSDEHRRLNADSDVHWERGLSPYLHWPLPQFPRDQGALLGPGLHAVVEALREIPPLNVGLWLPETGMVDDDRLRREGWVDFGHIDENGLQVRAVETWGGDVIGFHERRVARSPNVKPESEVIDEIDRLVNDQVRYGPRDDYQADRYDKCDDCGHDWHGLDCAFCGCLNTDWLTKKP